MIHARERGRLEGGGAGGRGTQGWVYARWKAVGEATEGKGERRATLLPSCSLLPRTKGTERAVCAINTRNSIQAHEEGYSYNATPSVTRSVVSRVPCSLRTFMALPNVAHSRVSFDSSFRHFHSRIFPRPSALSLPSVSGIYDSSTGHGGGGGEGGLHRRPPSNASASNSSSARSPVIIPRSSFDFANWYRYILGGLEPPPQCMCWCLQWWIAAGCPSRSSSLNSVWQEQQHPARIPTASLTSGKLQFQASGTWKTYELSRSIIGNVGEAIFPHS